MKLNKPESDDCNAPVWQQLLPTSVPTSVVESGEVRVNIPCADATTPEEEKPRKASNWFPSFAPSWSERQSLRNNGTGEEVFRPKVKSTSSSTGSTDGDQPPKSSTEKRSSSPLMRQNRWSSRRIRKRVVLKNGECNVVQSNVAKRRRRYLADIFTTMVDIQWRWTLLIFTASFVLSWLAFAVLWWLIAFTHGDLEPEHLPDNQGASGWKPCVGNIHGFASTFLFSIETQHTIGYGYRYTTEECPEGIFVMCIQSIIGVMIQAFMVGVVFSKLTRPKMRAQTLLFSRSAAICQRDDQLCLMFRVGDMRKSHIIDASIRAQMIQMRVTNEGEMIPYFQYELKVGFDHDESNLFLIWPMTVVHKITPDSPLYNVSASDLLKDKFEIVVILEGTVESTSMTTQARSSYLPSEIKWGHRFEPLVSFRKDTGQYAVDYSLFNNTYEVDTPLCSSRDLDEFKKLREENQTGNVPAKQATRPVQQTIPLQTMPLQLTYNRNLLIDPAIVNTPMMRGAAPLSLSPAPIAAVISSSNIMRPAAAVAAAMSAPVVNRVDPPTSDSAAT
ncbi:hypothetical protein DAPPUDRAFT_311738 [Daphnia pulex]|uniref:Uncharacterized protein n=1 Tax=Daphnia pulex TaxID=6669 RepID=E9FXS0_DAPPU|nr:hypothetical protein DAPPUDRAFT_311738 [Daphnia pulex]|eukprot:EFX88146.1 hypothetical protein DAPPUDRAFT_311738 [Daphnia pulex]